MRRTLPATRLQGFGTSIFAEMTSLAREHRAVNLSQGFPDFPGPEFVKRAAVEAIQADHNQYAPMMGEPVLRQAVADDLRHRHGLEFDPTSEITVFCGATEAIHCALLALCEPGDEVAILEPFYDSYPACCSMAGATPRFVTLRWPGLRWDLDELAAAFTTRTRLLLLNTPHNPTGRVLDGPEMEILAEFCRRRDLFCVADEVYDRLVFEQQHIPMATLPGMRERTVTIRSTGKTFSVTGWKVGYAAAPAPLSQALAQAHQFVTFAAPTPMQYGAAAALRAPDSYFRDLIDEYGERREFLLAGLRESGFEVAVPEGTYFIMADIRPLGFSDAGEFCRRLVREAGVAALPADALYQRKDSARHLVRFAFCKEMATLQEAVGRLRAFRRSLAR